MSDASRCLSQQTLHPIMIFNRKHWPLTFPAPATALSLSLWILLHWLVLPLNVIEWGYIHIFMQTRCC